MNRGLGKTDGLSLVEVMISLTMGTIVLMGVINLFSANSETYNLLQGQSRMQESARFALSYLSRDIQKAGYKGCFSLGPPPLFTMLLPTDIPYEFNMLTDIQAYEGQPAGWLPAIAPLNATYVAGRAINTLTIVATTDVLTVRSASAVEAALSVAMPLSTSNPIVTIPPAGMEISAATDDLALIYDCNNATLFEVTAINQAAGLATIAHAVEATIPGQPRNSFAGLTATDPFGTDASVAAIDTITYFIAPGAGINNEGNTPLALWRKVRTAAPVEMVEGVENLQLLFGEDTDADFVPNLYTTANLVANFNNVVTVRISLTVNSINSVGASVPPSLGCGIQDCISGEVFDGLMRRTFTKTVQLRN